jgi:hypothetical protein
LPDGDWLSISTPDGAWLMISTADSAWLTLDGAWLAISTYEKYQQKRITAGITLNVPSGRCLFALAESSTSSPETSRLPFFSTRLLKLS